MPKEPHNRYLTPISYNLLLKSIEHGSRFRMHPYVWNTRRQRMERSSETAHLVAWYLNALIPIWYFAFVVIRAIQTFGNESASPRETILSSFGVAFYLFPALFQLTYMLLGDEVPGLINQGLKLLTDANEKVAPPAKLEPQKRYPSEVRIAEFYNCVIYYGFQATGILVQIFGFVFPGTKFLVSSLHQEPEDLENPFRILSAMYLLYSSANYVISGWLLGMGLATVTFPLCVTFEALSNRAPTQEMLHLYRCLQLWVAKFSRVYSAVFLPICEIQLVALATLGIVGIIRYPGFIGLLVGNIGGTAYMLLYLLLRFFATIDTRSRRTVERWRRYGARGASTRQLRALRPISISIGSYFFIDRCLILTLTNFIVNNSITLLLVE